MDGQFQRKYVLEEAHNFRSQHGREILGLYVSWESLKKFKKSLQFLQNSRWEELGQYDLPASIDYVLKETGHEKVSYVGYSLGSAIFFVGANLKPDLNDKIEVMIGLAPTSTVQRLDNAFKLVAPFSTPLRVYKIIITFNDAIYNRINLNNFAVRDAVDENWFISTQ